MTRETLAAVLETEGIKGGPKGHAISEERDLTAFISTPGDVLHVSRVVRIDLRDAMVTFETAKKEHYYFAYEDVLGVRFGQPGTSKERSTGFGR